MRLAGASRVGAVLLLAGLAAPGAASASTYSVLHSFCGEAACADGAVPYAPLLMDASGNLYGTTSAGGDTASGTVFEMKSVPGGGWTYVVLHSFCPEGTSTCAGGAAPHGGLILDTGGNLYGTTTKGGSAASGIVYRLRPSRRAWKLDVLADCAKVCIGDSYAALSYSGAQTGDPYDGVSPLYGTTADGGTAGKGTAFELIPDAVGKKWKTNVLWNFCAADPDTCDDGANPYGGLVADAHGNLFGVTQHGNESDSGVVFELSGHGRKWHENARANFCGAFCHFGALPKFVNLGGDGQSYYLTTEFGGDSNQGVILQFMPHGRKSSIVWVAQFCCDGNFSPEGANPVSGLVLDAQGNMFGTTSQGGNHAIDPAGGGALFEYLKIDRSVASEYQFCALADCADGEHPAAALLRDASGHLFGTTTAGGDHGQGVVFEFTP